MSTAEILAAQAQGGPAAVQAYQAAQQQLAARQQTALGAMQQAAIARHAPAAEMAGQATVGYDALLNQMAVLQSSAGAEAANRSARMADYGQQAVMAGAMIPQQAQADASLIRARGETDIERIRAQGSMDIEERKLGYELDRREQEQARRDEIEKIKWQMRQQAAEAKAKAAKEAAEEKEKNTPTKAELAAMATLAARERIGSTAARAASVIERPGVETPKRPGFFKGIFDLPLRKLPDVVKKEDLPGRAHVNYGRGVPTITYSPPGVGTTRKPGGFESTIKEDAARKAKLAALQAVERKAKEHAAKGLGAYEDPVLMQSEVARQARAIAKEGDYNVTPELLAQIMGEPYLSAAQMDLRDRGMPFTTEALTKAGKTAEMEAEEAALEPLREQFQATTGLDLDDMLAATDVKPEAAAAYFADQAFTDDIAAFRTYVDSDPELKTSELDAWLRLNTDTAAQARILRYIVLGK